MLQFIHLISAKTATASATASVATTAVTDYSLASISATFKTQFSFFVI